MKIGILGGTFDPIHRAHLALGRCAMEAFGLDQIMVMPAGNSYFKTVTKHVTDSHYRAEMVKLAVEKEPGFVYSGFELERSGYTYTSDTLRQLTQEYPGNEWYFIIGADSLHTMGHWYAPEIIFRYADIIVANRNDQVPEEILERDRRALEERYPARIHLLPFRVPEISSSQIRETIIRNEDASGLVPEAVAEYIRLHHLYREPLTRQEICADLKRRLKPSRYEHTLGVAETCEFLAAVYGVETERAWLAGLVHDCGKPEGTALSHGPIGARIAREEYGITDPEILSAVACHTTGHAAMTTLEKILFIADYIEPHRDKAPHLKKLRRMATQDLDETIVLILRDTLDYLDSQRIPIDSRSRETLDYYTAQVRSRRGI